MQRKVSTANDSKGHHSLTPSSIRSVVVTKFTIEMYGEFWSYGGTYLELTLCNGALVEHLNGE